MNPEAIEFNKRLDAARVVPDIDGMDIVGRVAVFLTNGQPATVAPERLPYFVRAAGR